MPLAKVLHEVGLAPAVHVRAHPQPRALCIIDQTGPMHGVTRG